MLLDGSEMSEKGLKSSKDIKIMPQKPVPLPFWSHSRLAAQRVGQRLRADTSAGHDFFLEMLVEVLKGRLTPLKAFGTIRKQANLVFQRPCEPQFLQFETLRAQSGTLPVSKNA